MDLLEAVTKIAWRVGRRIRVWACDWDYSWYADDRLRELQGWCEGFLETMQSLICGGFYTGSAAAGLLNGANKLMELLLR